MRYLFLLLVLSTLFSCKKVIIEAPEPDSYRITILPSRTLGFNSYKVTGTLDVRNVSGKVEYGLLVGTGLNPTPENALKYAIGESDASVDFDYLLSDLDTGVAYTVRAYARHDKMIEYSANYPISKLSPKITHVDAELNHGRNFLLTTNISGADTGTVRVLLNGTPVPFQVSSKPELWVQALCTGQLLPGEYSVTLAFNQITLPYPKKITVLEGTWTSGIEVPGKPGGLNNSVRFISGDWFYLWSAYGMLTSTQAEFRKYNLRTGEQVILTPYDKTYFNSAATVIVDGSLVHFLGGNRAGGYQNEVPTAEHLVYNTATDRWTREADFPGGERHGSAGFLVGNKIYYGLGVKAGQIMVRETLWYDDFWSYDLSTKVWEKVSSMPAGPRWVTASFKIEDKLYLAAPMRPELSSGRATRETWCYDTSSGSWSRKADYPGEGEIGFVSFSIGETGYAGLGQSIVYDSYFGPNLAKDFYKYSTSDNRWGKVSDPGFGDTGPTSYSDGANGVVVGRGAAFYFSPK